MGNNEWVRSNKDEQNNHIQILNSIPRHMVHFEQFFIKAEPCIYDTKIFSSGFLSCVDFIYLRST